MPKLRIVFGLVVFLLVCGCTQDYRASIASDMRTLALSDDMVLGIRLPGDNWQISSEPPMTLVEEMAEHIEHELEEKGQLANPPTREQLKNAALKKLQSNEGYVFNPATGAHLDVDISRLGEGDVAPSARGVENSARYAVSSLEGDEGVSAVVAQVEKARLAGAQYAWRISADYKMHEEPRRFVGIVAFASPYWVYLYYTDPLKNDTDYGEMEEMLRSAVLGFKATP
ncbi:MAG: hypothetical protein AB7F21_14260 [Desulfuromonadales bacterium]